MNDIQVKLTMEVTSLKQQLLNATSNKGCSSLDAVPAPKGIECSQQVEDLESRLLNELRPTLSSVKQFKDEGNAYFRNASFTQALVCYEQGLSLLDGTDFLYCDELRFSLLMNASSASGRVGLHLLSLQYSRSALQIGPLEVKGE